MGNNQPSIQGFQSFLQQNYPDIANNSNTQKFLANKQTDLDTVSALQSGKIGLADIPIEKRASVAAMLPPDFQELTPDQKKAKDAMEVNKKNAQAVLNVLEMGKSGTLNDKEFQDALRFAASQFNKQAFAEGGKVLSGAELAILAGSMITTRQPRNPNIFERLTGDVPAATGEILDKPDQIARKMMLVINGPEALAKNNVQSDNNIGSVSYNPDKSNNANYSNLEVKGNKSVSGFVSNAVNDVKSNVEGIASLPGVAADMVTGKVNPVDVVKSVLTGAVDEYANIAQHPIESFYQKPVSTTLDLLPLLQIGKAAMAGKVGTAAKAASEAKAISTAAGIAGKTDEAAILAKKLASASDDIDNIITKANRVGKTSEVSPLARNVYQSVIAVSKKNNAFEKLHPAQTVESMIKYGVGGNTDDILRTVNTVTGEDGIISNVVNSAISDTKGVVDSNKALKYINKNKTGKFSDLSPQKVDELSSRLGAYTGSEGGKLFDLSLDKAIKLERDLESEAVQHMIDSAKNQNTAAGELGQLKFGVAEEIGKEIDRNVSNVTIAKYKDPRIIAELKRISPRLAEDYTKAKTISELRSLQRDFVRMSKMIQLAQNETSSLGSKFFNIPGVGPVARSASESLVTPLVTNGAINLNKMSPILNPAYKTATNPYTLLLARQNREEL